MGEAHPAGDGMILWWRCSWCDFKLFAPALRTAANGRAKRPKAHLAKAHGISKAPTLQREGLL
eukprot:5428990-Prorocentrum_lima.AAC.1